MFDLLYRFYSHLRERKKSKARSSKWDKVRDNFILKNNKCEACGGSINLQVHHIIPYHIEESKELDDQNLITLCMGKYNCHLHIGHGGSFKYYNPDVVRDSKRFKSSFFKSKENLIKEIKEKRLLD